MRKSSWMMLVVLLCAALGSTSARADSIAPGESVSPDVYTLLTTPTALDEVTGTFNVDGGALIGSYVEGVVVDPLGVTCAGCLDFFVHINISSSTDSVYRVGLDSFKGTATDVGYISGSGDVNPTSVLWASNGSTLSSFFGSSPGVNLSGESTDYMVVATDATAYSVGGSLGIGGFSTPADTYNNALAQINGMILPVATPEPGIVSLLSIGLLALMGYSYRRKRLA